MSKSKRVLWRVGLALPIMASAFCIPAFASSITSPQSTNSFYVTSLQGTANTNSVLQYASIIGSSNPDQLVVLDFGEPRYNSKTKLYGTELFDNATFASTQDIAAFVDEFASYFNQASPTGNLTIALGTSNYGNQVSQAHGAAWGSMVQQVETAMSSLYGTRINVVGADDIEMNWTGPHDTLAWVTGFHDADPTGDMYDYGNAGSTPQAQPGASTYLSGSSGHGWSMQDLWEVASGIDPATFQPLPEIYTTDNSEANQWLNLALYAKQAQGQTMTFAGALSQLGTSNTNNTPIQSWESLDSDLNSNSTTAQSLPFSTMIEKQS